jgi:hypothetical protein
MLITKFNALIRNRFIWGFFAVLVSITMVGFFTNSGGCESRETVQGSVGDLDGTPITRPALDEARFNVYLRLQLTTGREFNRTPELDALVTREAWKRLAMLQLAESEKLWAGDTEVAAAVHRDPMFQTEGVFSADNFNQFMQVLRQRFGMTPSQFWSYLRQELTLDKIRRTVSAGVWTAPAEVERLARNFADSFTVDYIEAARGSLTRDVTVTEAQIRAYYDTHTAAFTIPDLVQVSYAAFAYADYTNLPPSPEALTNYYAEHMNDFYYTNAAGEAAFRKIEDVESVIKEKLAADLGRIRAYDEAARFNDSLYDLGGTGDFFRAACSATGKTARLTRFFAANEPLRELGVGPDFNAAAFALTPEKNANFSEPIFGSNAVFVLAYESARPSRIPALTEAHDDAEARALAEARSKALQERGERIASQVRDAVRKGVPFAAAAKTAGLDSAVKTAGPFTAYTAPEPFGNARLVSAIISLQEGEISDLVQSEDGSLFLVRCKTRTLGDPGAVDPIRNQIRTSLNRRHSQLLVSQWEEDLLKKMGYKEPAPAQVETDEEAGSESGPKAPSGAPGVL